MADKNYFVSMVNHFIDSGVSPTDWSPDDQKQELVTAGATIVNEFANIDSGFYELTIDESNISSITDLANVKATEVVGAGSNVSTLAISESTTEWHKQRLVTRNLPLRDTFDPVYEGDNSTVYIVDSGCDILHPELANATIQKVHNPTNGGYNDFIGGGGDASTFTIEDDHGHGTAMASFIAGDKLGVARNAKIGVVKVSGANGSADISDVAKGVNSMFTHRAWETAKDSGGTYATAVALMAFTFPKSEALDRLITCMWNRRFLVVAAAGNAGGDVDNYSPGGLNSILTVGASDSSDNVPAFSNDAGAVVEPGTGLQTNGGEEVDVFAPGVAINLATISNRNEGGGYDSVADEDLYEVGSGTSASAAIVAGVSAIAVQRNPGYKAEQVKDFVQSQSLTGMLFQDPGLYSTTPNNIVYLENEYYATVWNTNPGSLGETLISGASSVDLALDVANTVTGIASSEFAALPPALELSGNATDGWKLTANTTVTAALTEDKIYNFILTATKNDNTEFNRHFAYGFYTGSEITDSKRDDASETYFVVDGSDTEEVLYIKGMQAAFGGGNFQLK
jgi:predicted aspartyl protease